MIVIRDSFFDEFKGDHFSKVEMSVLFPAIEPH